MFNVLYNLSMVVVLIAMAVTLPPFALLWLPIIFAVLCILMVAFVAEDMTPINRIEAAICVMFAVYAVLAHNGGLPLNHTAFVVYYIGYALMHLAGGVGKLLTLDD